MANAKNGTFVGVFMDGTLLAKSTENSIDFTTDIRDATNKDSGIWKCNLPSTMGASISCTGLHADGDDVGVSQLFAAKIAQAPVALRFTDNVATNLQFVGDFYITALTVNAPDKGNMTYSATFQNAGAVTEIANP